MVLPCLMAAGMAVLPEWPSDHASVDLLICEDQSCVDAVDRQLPVLLLGWQMPEGLQLDAQHAFLCKVALAERVLLRSVAQLLGCAEVGSAFVSPDAAADTRYSGKVLVAEDNLINQRVVSAFLGKLGCEVVLAVNGVEAIAAANLQDFDLVLMDWQMPEMDGLAATRVLRSQERTRILPIIALTANAFEHSENECLAAGMDGFLAKPLDLMKLKNIVAQYLPEQAAV